MYLYIIKYVNQVFHSKFLISHISTYFIRYRSVLFERVRSLFITQFVLQQCPRSHRYKRILAAWSLSQTDTPNRNLEVRFEAIRRCMRRKGSASIFRGSRRKRTFIACPRAPSCIIPRTRTPIIRYLRLAVLERPRQCISLRDFPAVFFFSLSLSFFYRSQQTNTPDVHYFCSRDARTSPEVWSKSSSENATSQVQR